MKRTLKSLVAGVLVAVSSSCAVAAPYRLGVAGYTFCRTKLAPALEILDSADCHRLAIKDFHLKYDATDAEIAAFKRQLAAKGVTAEVAGPHYFRTEAEARLLFEFARRYGLKTVVGIPYEIPEGQNASWQNRVESDRMLDVAERLVKEYDIRFAIHNHGPDAPKLFPTAASIMKRLAGRDARLGLCLDVCHERRAGADPVKSILRWGDRIYDVHVNNIRLRDVKPVKGKIPYLAVPGGRGDMDLGAIFRALAEVEYAGVVHIEDGRDHHGTEAKELRETIAYCRGCIDTVVDPVSRKEGRKTTVRTVVDRAKVRRP